MDSGGSEGNMDSGAQCEGTVNDACTQTSCIRHWPTNLADFCSVATSLDWAGIHEHCGSYNVFFNVSVDNGNMYYYDINTGNLVAIVHVNNYTRTCFAGAPDFTEPEPHCDDMLTPLKCQDGGISTDAGGDNGDP